MDTNYLEILQLRTDVDSLITLLDALRSYLMATIGWTQERTDEVLVPVICDMNRRELEGTQANITQFFSGGIGTGTKQQSANSAFAPRRRVEGKSKRMETALGRLHEQARKRTVGDGEGPAVDREVDGEAEGAEVRTGTLPEEDEAEQPKKAKGRKRAATRDGSATASDDSHDEYEASKRARKARSTTTTRARGKRN
ncbi:MAG: hypothetical protein Q9181_000319 [Wetmoreana brouardii]